jgi:hypothetical protein
MKIASHHAHAKGTSYLRRPLIKYDYEELKGGLANSIRFFETLPISHKTIRSDCMAGCGLLTGRRVRHITSVMATCERW